MPRVKQRLDPSPGCILPSGPSPCGWLSQPLSTMPDDTLGACRAWAREPSLPPGSWFSHKRVGSSIVPFSGFPIICLNNCIPFSCCPHDRSPLGLPEFYDVSLPTCHVLWTPADLHILAISDASVLPSVYVKTLGVRIDHFEAIPALQGARSPLQSIGFSAYA